MPAFERKLASGVSGIEFHDTLPDALGLAGQMVEIDAEIKEAEALVASIKARRQVVEEQLLEQFAESGTQSVKVNGRTVSMRRDLYSKVLDPERLNDALRAAGFGDLIEEKVNSMRLSALVREIDRGDVERPAEFEGVVEASERFSIRVTAK